MICRPKRSISAPIIASIGSKPHRARSAGALRALVLVLLLPLLLGLPVSSAQTPPAGVDPEVARLLEGALHDLENVRKQLRTIEYDAHMRVQEWDSRGQLRGTARARAIMRPGTAQPMTFVSREVEGKVRLPENRRRRKNEKQTTLREFAEKHRIAERYDFTVRGTQRVAGQRARRVVFQPKKIQPRQKNTADRFLGVISGTAWVGEETNKLVKFELQLLEPFQLFWIFAVLKDLSIQYELLAPGEVLGRSKLQVSFNLHTAVANIRQQHDVELDNFRRRETPALAALTPATN